MPLKGGLGRIAGFKRRNFFGKFIFARLRKAGGAGKLAEVIFPVGILGQFPVVHFLLGRFAAFLVLLQGGIVSK